MNATVTKIKDTTTETAASMMEKAKAACTSNTAKDIGKTVALGAGVAVGLGAAYAVFATVANKAYAALN